MFDEIMGLGVGIFWGCGDDIDYLFCCINVDLKIYYNF